MGAIIIVYIYVRVSFLRAFVPPVYFLYGCTLVYFCGVSASVTGPEVPCGFVSMTMPLGVRPRSYKGVPVKFRQSLSEVFRQAGVGRSCSG